MVGKHGRGKHASECDDLEAVGTHGRGKPWSLDKSGTYYHDTPWQADAFIS